MIVKKIICVVTSILILALYPVSVLAEEVEAAEWYEQYFITDENGLITGWTDEYEAMSFSERASTVLPYFIDDALVAADLIAGYPSTAFLIGAVFALSDGLHFSDEALTYNDDGTATFHAGGGSFTGSGAGRQPNGYSGEGVPSVDVSGVLNLVVEPYGFYRSTKIYTGFCSDIVEAATFLGTSSFYSESFPTYFGLYYKITAPVSGVYHLGSPYTYTFATGRYYKDNVWNGRTYTLSWTSAYYYQKVLNAGESVYFAVRLADMYSVSPYIGGQNYYTYGQSIVVMYDDIEGNLTTVNNFYFNGTLISVAPEGNIYFDSSTNLYYSYDAGENCTIYSPENNYTITYDNTTNNYIITIYNVQQPTPTPGPTSTPESGQPGTGGESADLGFISDFFDWWKEQWTNFTAWLADVLGGGSGSGGSGDGSPSGSDSPSWWEKLLGALGEGILGTILGAIQAVLLGLLNLLGTLLNWIVWAVLQAGSLLPFLPPGAGVLLAGGAVVLVVLSVIKFIRG